MTFSKVIPLFFSSYNLWIIILSFCEDFDTSFYVWVWICQYVSFVARTIWQYHFTVASVECILPCKRAPDWLSSAASPRLCSRRMRLAGISIATSHQSTPGELVEDSPVEAEYWFSLNKTKSMFRLFVTTLIHRTILKYCGLFTFSWTVTFVFLIYISSKNIAYFPQCINTHKPYKMGPEPVFCIHAN